MAETIANIVLKLATKTPTTKPFSSTLGFCRLVRRRLKQEN